MSSTLGTLPSMPKQELTGVVAGRYVVERELGHGGMGRVYVARDQRFDRRVALKVLSAAQSEDALRRFEVEARAAGALNHPNVVAVHDVGVHDGQPYLVSELLEGETLRQMLDKALPVKRAVELAAQLAQGLAAAHEKGVIHRDLKPENLFVTADGHLKILDFGIAKLTGEREASGPITLTGTVMGTVGYMSPEQLRGEHADHRTDIFSFGAILHEMLTGRVTFERGTPYETGSAILHDEPAPLPGNVPAELDAVVRRCLEKNPRDRFQSARDLAFQLRTIPVESSGTVMVRARRRSMRRALVAFALLGLAVALVGAGVVVGRKTQPAPPRFVRISTNTGNTPTEGRLAGDEVIFSSSAGERADLFSSRIADPFDRALGIDDAFVTAVSPAGDLALILRSASWTQLGPQPGTLSRARVSGGAPRELAEDVISADWLPDGNLVAIRQRGKPSHFTLEWPLGHPVLESDTPITNVKVAPDASVVAVQDQPYYPDDRGWVAIVDAKGTKRRLGPEFTAVQGIAWAPSGREIWLGGISGARDAGMSAITLDGATRTLLHMPAMLRVLDVDRRGRALVRIMQRRLVVHCGRPGDAGRECGARWFSEPVDISRDGRKVLLADYSEPEGATYGVWVRDTSGASAAVRLGDGQALHISPRGTLVLAALFSDGHPRYVIYPTASGTQRQLTLPEGHESVVETFTADEQRVVFSLAKAGKIAFFEAPVDGSPGRFIDVPGCDRVHQVLADGTILGKAGPTRLCIKPPGKEPRVVDVPTKASFYAEDMAPDGSVYLSIDEPHHHTWSTARLSPSGQFSTVFSVQTHEPDRIVDSLVAAPLAGVYSWAVATTTADLYLVEGLH